MAADEVIFGDWVLRLDDNVVEVLHRTGLSYRFHVNHVAVEAQPREAGIGLRIGIEVEGAIVEGTTVEVPVESQPQVEALFAEARERRERAGGAPAD